MQFFNQSSTNDLEKAIDNMNNALLKVTNVKKEVLTKAINEIVHDISKWAREGKVDRQFAQFLLTRIYSVIYENSFPEVQPK